MYSTNSLKGYRFPTHRTDLIIDREESEAVEVFFAVLQPGEKTSLHKHDDCEQLWYVIEGCGVVHSDPEGRQQPIRAGDVVLSRRNVLHSVENNGPTVLRYLAVDVFVGQKPAEEPTWDSHVAAICRQNGWTVSVADVKYCRAR